MIRIGVAGLGNHGRRYADHLLGGEVQGAALAAVWRRDEVAGRAFAREHGIVFAPDLEALVTMDAVDAVVVALPPDLHADVALACIAAGRPVLVEKPMAADPPSAAALTRAAEATGAFVMVAHTLRFDPLIRALRYEIPRLGSVRLVAINQRFEPATRAWLDEPGRGGAILNTGVHAFDLLRHLTGAEAVSVTAEAASFVTRETEDEFAAVFRLEPGGILATVDNTRTTGGRSGRIEIVGDRGQLRADHIHRTFHHIEGREERDLGPVAARPTVVEVLKALTECLARGATPPVTVRDGLASVETAAAVQLSARLGRRVRIEEMRVDSGPAPA